MLRLVSEHSTSSVQRRSSHLAGRARQGQGRLLAPVRPKLVSDGAAPIRARVEPRLPRDLSGWKIRWQTFLVWLVAALATLSLLLFCFATLAEITELVLQLASPLAHATPGD